MGKWGGGSLKYVYYEVCTQTQSRFHADWRREKLTAGRGGGGWIGKHKFWQERWNRKEERVTEGRTAQSTGQAWQQDVFCVLEKGKQNRFKGFWTTLNFQEACDLQGEGVMLKWKPWGAGGQAEPPPEPGHSKEGTTWLLCLFFLFQALRC